MENKQFEELMNAIEKTNDRVDRNFNQLESEIKTTNDRMDEKFEELMNAINKTNDELKETRLEMMKKFFDLEQKIETEVKDFKEINNREHNIMKEDIQVGRRERKEI